MDNPYTRGEPLSFRLDGVPGWTEGLKIKKGGKGQAGYPTGAGLFCGGKTGVPGYPGESHLGYSDVELLDNKTSAESGIFSLPMRLDAKAADAAKNKIESRRL